MFRYMLCADSYLHRVLLEARLSETFENKCNIFIILIDRCHNKLVMKLFQRMVNMVLFKRNIICRIILELTFQICNSVINWLLCFIVSLLQRRRFNTFFLTLWRETFISDIYHVFPSFFKVNILKFLVFRILWKYLM